MLREGIKEEIDAAIEEAVFLEKVPDKNALLKHDLGFDSLSLVELIAGFEERFAIQFDESDLDPQNLETVDDIYQLIARYVEEPEE